jgi:predicted ATPase
VTPPELFEIRAENFRSLKNVSVSLGRINVLVGPNAAGKSNLIDVVGFLRDAARLDLIGALQARGGMGRVQFRGAEVGPVSLGVSCKLTQYASEGAPDDYSLTITPLVRNAGKVKRRLLSRREEFTFKRTQGRGRRMTISGSQVQIAGQKAKELLKDEALGLSTLPRLSGQGGYPEVETLAMLLSSFRVFDVDVKRARLPSPLAGAGTLFPEDNGANTLASNASNLSAFLMWLAENHGGAFEALQQDAREIIPGLAEIQFAPIGGSSEAVVAELVEHNLKGYANLGEASFGSIRALALLALLHDPAPPALTCIEEFDHGLHPYAFDLLVDRLRDASSRTQFLLATHSPTLVNRLRPTELIVCERDPTTGASRIPAISPAQLQSIYTAGSKHDLRLGEIWFSGTLGGVLPA